LPTKENKFPFSVFHLQKTNESFPLPFSVCSKQTEVAGKPKPGRFSLVLLLFAHRAFGSLSFFVRLRPLAVLKEGGWAGNVQTGGELFSC
jgi:hypothetical protein